MSTMRRFFLCLGWRKLKRQRFLVTVVAAAVVMVLLVNNHIRRGYLYEVLEPGGTEEPFIPESPNQIPIGKPADVPRQFLIEEADACVRQGEDVEVVAYVHSAISRVKQRQQTRLTWANSTALNMVVMFMVGRAKNKEEEEIVQRESELYHDIVQGDYGDHYHLLSYKALSSLYWITRNCAHVPWTLHADDDLLIDTYILQNLIQEFDSSPNRETLHCRLLKKQRVFRKGRWKVSRKMLPLRRYPPFCQGTVWFIPTSEVSKLVAAAGSVKLLWVDDAYITGVLAKHVGMKISAIPDSRFGIAAYANEDLGEKLAWFHIRDRNMTDLWPDILQYHNVTAES